MTDQTGLKGILTYNQYVEEQHQNAVKLFELLVEERGDDADLIALVTRESLLQLVLHTIDHAKTIRAKVNARKSNQGSIEAKSTQIRLLHQWLDLHIDEYKGNLDACADAASIAIKGLGRSPIWCRQEITMYRKLKKVGASNQ